MPSRKELMLLRLKLLRDTVSKIERSKKLYSKVKNLDHLAKMTVEIMTEDHAQDAIGYSTLLKHSGQYRGVLEESLSKISKLNASSLSSRNKQHGNLSILDSAPSNWVAEKALLQCKISNLNEKLTKSHQRNEQLELTLAQIDQQLGNGNTDVTGNNTENETRKMCHSMAHLLDWLNSSDLGVIYDQNNNTITDIYGEVIVNSQYLTPYSDWQSSREHGGNNE
ncbi:hypothetical protein MD535_08325 [Vibrio sp. ZSDZ65]|uniref:Uncharacterized protein n=1 Tax=Vibrio qingdaonensis TaxID=2829491 RepID=A0A9X3HWP9_9VIBR|nr:hypothetical protein [Vibrio qingdaonensis]MCW8346012.1 hypothetical protein [Vibrio qingdaonensis]